MEVGAKKKKPGELKKKKLRGMENGPEKRKRTGEKSSIGWGGRKKRPQKKRSDDRTEEHIGRVPLQQPMGKVQGLLGILKEASKRGGKKRVKGGRGGGLMEEGTVENGSCRRWQKKTFEKEQAEKLRKKREGRQGSEERNRIKNLSQGEKRP